MRDWTLLRLDLIAAALALLAMPAGALPIRNPPPPLVITHDGGGRVDRMAARIERLQAEGRQVEIAGECVSACTMYLAIACVRPEARLTFHGPSYYGWPLNAYDFDHWSRVIAAHYPPPLADWFMGTARHRNLVPLPPLGQAQLVKMGARACGG